MARELQNKRILAHISFIATKNNVIFRREYLEHITSCRVDAQWVLLLSKQNFSSQSLLKAEKMRIF